MGFAIWMFLVFATSGISVTQSDPEYLLGFVERMKQLMATHPRVEIRHNLVSLYDAERVAIGFELSATESMIHQASVHLSVQPNSDTLIVLRLNPDTFDNPNVSTKTKYCILWHEYQHVRSALGLTSRQYLFNRFSDLPDTSYDVMIDRFEEEVHAYLEQSALSLELGCAQEQTASRVFALLGEVPMRQYIMTLLGFNGELATESMFDSIARRPPKDGPSKRAARLRSQFKSKRDELTILPHALLWVTHEGTAQLQDGRVRIPIDLRFNRLVSPRKFSENYQVFIKGISGTFQGYIVRHDGSFEVIDERSPELVFRWEILSKRRGLERFRYSHMP
ncbi:MAG: hypothetical protein HY567_02290 [Candidatus Kerfeldbacteria bacterium]|nr:hypothetical protein [Candidatus Kerfeldbacteria bacterium]